MNNYLIPPWGEPKGSPIRHKRPISPMIPISPKDTLPPLGGLRGASNIAILLCCEAETVWICFVLKPGFAIFAVALITNILNET